MSDFKHCLIIHVTEVMTHLHIFIYYKNTVLVKAGEIVGVDFIIYDFIFSFYKSLWVCFHDYLAVCVCRVHGSSWQLQNLLVHCSSSPKRWQ